jgi:hypothetical protein
MDPIHASSVINPGNLSVAFAVWAAVVGMIGVAIVWELSRLRAEIRHMANMLNLHQLETQGRLTAVETHLHLRDGFVSSSHRWGQ